MRLNAALDFKFIRNKIASQNYYCPDHHSTYNLLKNLGFVPNDKVLINHE